MWRIIRPIFILVLLLLPGRQGAGTPGPGGDEDFCTVFFRIIKSAVETNFESIKGENMGLVMKGSNKIEKWKSVENLPGYTNGIISKSFGTSFFTTIWESNEVDASMTGAYDQFVLTIDDCLSPAWVIQQTPKEGLYKKMSISRRQAEEVLKFPNITLEINRVDDKYALQLRIVK